MKLTDTQKKDLSNIIDSYYRLSCDPMPLGEIVGLYMIDNNIDEANFEDIENQAFEILTELDSFKM